MYNLESVVTVVLFLSAISKETLNEARHDTFTKEELVNGNNI